MKKLVVEFIGTFFLVFTVGCAVVSSNANPPLAIGAVLMVMIFAGGYISGGHYNPAVSLAVFLRGRMTGSELAQYWIVQLIGGLLGAIMSHVVTGNDGSVNMSPGADVSATIAILAEAIGTFALAYVVLNVATSKGTAGNPTYGLAIGFTVFAMAVALGGISGGAFNPAVGVGRTVADMIVGSGTSTGNWWLYIVGPGIGGALAALAFRFLNPDDK